MILHWPITVYHWKPANIVNHVIKVGCVVKNEHAFYYHRGEDRG